MPFPGATQRSSIEERRLVAEACVLLRARMGWSQRRLSLVMKVGYTTICRWERLRTAPTPERLADLNTLLVAAQLLPIPPLRVAKEPING